MFGHGRPHISTKLAKMVTASPEVARDALGGGFSKPAGGAQPFDDRRSRNKFVALIVGGFLAAVAVFALLGLLAQDPYSDLLDITSCGPVSTVMFDPELVQKLRTEEGSVKIEFSGIDERGILVESVVVPLRSDASQPTEIQFVSSRRETITDCEFEVRAG